MRVSLVGLIFLLCLALKVRSVINPRDEFLVDYKDYYYTNLKVKMSESLSLSNCTVGYEADLFSRVVAPPKTVTKQWGSFGKEKLDEHKIFFRTSPQLCKSKQFFDIKMGHYKGAKGCMGVLKSRNNLKESPIPPRFAATLHPDHIRCKNSQAVAACAAGAKSPAVVPYTDRHLHSYPFIMTANNVIVAKSGFLSLPCGAFGLLASCEAVKWGVPAARAVVGHVAECRDPNAHCPFKKYDKVFVMTQYDDTQIGQFILEALPKLIYHLDYIRNNKDVMIHYGFSKLAVLPTFVLPHMFFQWLGLSDRLLNGTIYANEVMVPREGGCQDASYNAWEVLTQRETFLKMSKEDARSVQLSIERPKLLLLTRSPGKFTQNKGDIRSRRWPKDFYPSVLDSLRREFPHLDVEVFSDANETIMSCPPCQVRMFSNARVVIGVHGAGLTNILYMPLGGVVIEVVNEFDSRHSPAIGIFPRLAAIVGLHHYLYYTKNGTMSYDLQPDRFAKDAAEFARSVAHWA